MPIASSTWTPLLTTQGLPYAMGDSRGHWEGNTLVADVTSFSDATWLDAAGNYHSDALHVVERYTRTDRDTLLYEATHRGSEGVCPAVENPYAATPSDRTWRPDSRGRVR